MKILITGANGFIGSRILEFLVNNGYEVNILIRKTSNLNRITNFLDKVKIFYGDVRDKDSLKEPIKNSDFIIHCAAVLRCIKKETYYEVNHQGTKNLIETVVSYKPQLNGIIYLSSQAAAGPSKGLNSKNASDESTPVSHYGKSKFLAEQELLKYSDKINTIILCPAAVYGPYDKDMFLYFKMAQNGVLPLFNKEFYIQFVYIYDLIKIISKIIINFDSIQSNKLFVAEDKCYSAVEIRDIFSEVFNRKIKIIVIPYFVGYVCAYFNEKFYKIMYNKPAVFNRDKLKELSNPFWLCHSSDVKKYFLDFEYTCLKSGLKQTYEWYVENGWL